MKNNRLLLLFICLFTLSLNAKGQNIYLYAGSPAGTGGYTGDGTGLTSFELDASRGVAWDHSGNMIIADYSNNRIRKISGTTISTIAGNGTAGFAGDGGPATAATCEVNGPVDVTVDGAGNIYFSDQNNNRIRKISTTGIITTIAGNGTAGYGGDGGPATASSCELNLPVGVTFDHHGNLFIGDQFNNRIREISPAGTITTFAGNGTPGFTGDGTSALTAEMHYPMYLRFDMWGVLFFEDRENNRIRVVTPAGIINSVAGFGTAGFAGDGTPATNAEFSYVDGGLRFDGAGNLYVADGNNFNVREITAVNGHIASTDTIRSIAGTHTSGFTGDGGPATAATFKTLNDVLTDSTGNYYVVDGGNNVIRLVDIRNQRPHFVNGTAQSLTVCENSTFDSINSLLTVLDTNSGQTLTWNIFKAPSNGTAVAHYSQLITGTSAITPIGLYYTPTTGFSGQDTFVVWVNDGYALDTTEIIVTVNPIPVITGRTSFCVGTTDTLTALPSGGTWSSSSVFVATIGTSTGIAVGLSTGVTIITDLLPTGCLSSINDTVNALPSLYTVTGGGAFCAGGTGVHVGLSGSTVGVSYQLLLGGTPTGSPLSGIGSALDFGPQVVAGTYTVMATSGSGCTRLMTGSVVVAINPVPSVPNGNLTICAGTTTTLTDSTSGGDWSSVTMAVATVGSLSGTVLGVAAGTSIISYTLTTTGCASSVVVTVNNAPVAISPSSTSVCIGSTVTLTDGTSGGTWSASNGHGTVVGGVVTGVSAGTDTVTYAIGTCATKATVTVNALPNPITPPGPVTLCVGGTITLNTGSSGFWTSHNTVVASISVGGLVTALAAGTDTISFTNPSGCSVIKVITVNVAPAAISPASTSVCIGSTVTLTDGTSGGTWSASNGHGTVAGGIVTGFSAGVDTITYAIGSCATKATVTVNALPNPITPAGAVSICVGSTATLTDGTPGGTWSSGSTGVATVGTSGVVLGVGIGAATISYTNAAGCSALKIVTVNANPAAISPASSSVCAGSTVTLTDATGGGVWSSSNGHATVAGGIVSGVSAGNDTITYAVGTCQVTATVSVNALPAAITPAGPINICAGTTATLSDVTPGGTWSSGSTGVATVAGGVVTGVTAGTAVISYTNAASCSATESVTVIAAPSPIMPASPTVCTGATTTLTDASGGGSWTSGSPAVATIGSASGIANGLTVGTSTITYTVGTCTTTTILTVNLSPNAGSISGAVTVCTGTSITLTDGAGGGVWSSSNVAVASVGSGTGIVFGASAGTATITYSVTNTCGTATATHVVTVNSSPTAGAITGLSTVCAGTVTVYTNPVTGGVWTASNANATITGTGLLTGITPGVDTIKYTVTTPCGTASTTKVVTIGMYLTAGTISGPGSVCAGSNITLTDLAPSGVWSSSNSHAFVSGGVVTGVSAGTDTILYTVTGSCGSVSATHTVVVNPLPNAGIITGPVIVCDGTATPYTESVSGGTWSVTNTLGTISGTGLFTSISMGTDTIKYTFTNTCGTAVTTKAVTIGAYLTAGTITGASSVCAGTSITLTDATTGGVWSSSNAHATVSSGLVTGVSAGIDTILYTVTSSCGSTAATHAVTVNPAPNAGSISGPSSVCLGSTAPYTDAITGGVWSLTNVHATVSFAGVVTPVSTGTDTLKYSVTNSCGTATVTMAISIGLTTSAGTITGPGAVCIGSGITLLDGVTGGTWSATNGHATVSGAGLVIGVSSGVDTIKYTVTGSCGSAFASATVTVSPAPNAGSITGPSTICIGTLSTYTDPATGGTWSMSNAHATVSGAGVVTPVSAGTDTLMYSVTTGCGTSTATLAVTIGTTVTAGTISGPGTVCIGTPITLTDGVSGGVWSSSNADATVSGAGIVTGVTPGIDTIRYTVSNSCGTAVATATVTVNATITAGVIVGPATVCLGTFTIYTDAAGGGTWSMSNGSATITLLGGVLNTVAMGIDTVIYTVTNACGTAVAIKPVTIGSALSAGTISGPTSVCVGSSITLTDGVTGGVWSASNAHGSITSGLFTGLSAGTDTVSYTVTNSCGTATATYVVNINSATGAGIISGPSAVCVGSLITMTETVGGGVWSSSNTDATITIGGGVVTGIAPGIDTISYTISNACGTVSTTKVITVNSSSGAGTISGPSGVCVGSAITLTDGVSGGVWTSSNTSASVGGTGIVTGLAAGTDTIMYTVTNSCGVAIATHVVAVNSAATAGVISGPSGVCVSSLISLTESVGGGAWSSSNSRATITTGGVVTGITPGIDTITYTISNACGLVSTTKIITISSTPVVAAITGPGSVCVGASISLSDLTTGGIWTSSNTNASVGSSTGLVTGISTGTDVITYAITNSCGTASSTYSITINPLPVAGTITGPDSVCAGATITLSDGASGGTWSAGNTNASVSIAGVVTGASGGTDPISYTVANSCGAVSAVSIITVIAHPFSGTISGPFSVCVGSGITLTDPSPGGMWLSSNSTAMVVGPGIIDGASVGIDTIYYTVSGVCGSSSASKVISVNPIPAVAPITGPSTQGIGTLVTMTDAVTGGVWISSTPAIATIGVSSGVANGVSAGTTTLTYTVTNSFGCPASVTALHTVSGAGRVMSPTSICVGATAALNNQGLSGTWSSADTKVANVNENGVVIGVGVGSVDINFVSATGNEVFNITVSSLPDAGTITGPLEATTGTTIDVTDAVTGGTWSSTNEAVALVSEGSVSAVTEGMADIIYTVSNQCGSSSAKHSLSVTAPGSTKVSCIAEPVSELSVYPNPNNGQFTLILRSEKDEQVAIIITDVKGAIVREMTCGTNQLQNITLNQAAGIYMLNVVVENRKYVQKLIVE